MPELEGGVEGMGNLELGKSGVEFFLNFQDVLLKTYNWKTSK